MHKMLGFRGVRALFGAIGLGGLALAAGCSYSKGPEPTPVAVACSDPTAATYAAVIAPIYDAQCRSCHGSSTYQALGGGHDFSTYQGVKSQPTSLLIGCIEHQPGFDAMPKGAAKLSDCDIARIEAWITAGQPNN